ncbi:hypothetical protein GGI25_005251 [Coemansia spiralis]|uniref:t-SNARE coiled-coil homology domain-containing protein n=2 Tax=Coemansia TaxID=4863 RepID=A0A9W8G377_9FUNG|nr:t-SNARE [Coemansia spiralis]KAJ1986695.1 hypothetical protein EDC05_006200 [Coemansia umbellata]KAJ2621397.1 hypothetical protein GGI26_004179 [Coemansia sp. RSA 1358]KAJ2672057.1 hypothetical protein GGI25_005251 [Coemansia spiralis]
MSFNDLDRGTYAPTNQAAVPDEERLYKRTVQELSRKVFQINASVANIRQLVGQLGTVRDTSRLRQDIHDKMEATRDLVKLTTGELKALSEFQTGAKRRARRLEQQKLTADFQKVLEQFQNIQRVSAEVTREFVDRAKHAAQHENEETSPLLQQQGGRLELAVLENDLEYNEALINERESEINEIEQGIVELNEIFRDLGTIVTEQQSLLDNIETNVQNVSSNLHGASGELSRASEYQRKANKTKFCILLFAIIFFLIILLLALS